MARQTKISQMRIARDLGVSQGLVSLALNGRRTGINARTYDRIWEHATRLGYAPKGMHLAGALATLRPRQVGFILRAPLRLHSQSNFFSHVQHGLHTTLQAAGCSTVFLGTEEDLTAEKLERALGDSRSLLGVVLFGEVRPRFLGSLLKRNPRVVAISATHPGRCASVTSDERGAVGLLVDHLVGLGHTRFAWIGGNLALGRHRRRRGALRELLGSRGLPPAQEIRIAGAEADRAQGAEAAARWLASTRRSAPATALVCYNGLMARGLVNALHKAGVAVPGDVSVAAIDRTRVLTEEHPFLTGAAALPEEMGEAAARLLLERTDDGAHRLHEIVLPARIRPGESTGPARPPPTVPSATPPRSSPTK